MTVVKSGSDGLVDTYTITFTDGTTTTFTVTNGEKGEQGDDCSALSPYIFYDREIDIDITSTLNIEEDSYYSDKKYSEANCACSNLIGVNAGDKLKITAAYGYGTPLIAEFNSSQQIVSYGVINLGKCVAVDDYEYTVPDNISYIAVNTRDKQNNPIKVTKIAKENVKMRIEALEQFIGGLIDSSATITDQLEGQSENIQKLQSDSADLAEAIGKSVTIVDITSTLTITHGKCMSTQGNLLTNANGQVTEMFPVKPGETYYVTGEYGYTACLIAEFDSNMEFVNAEGKAGDQTMVAYGYKYTVPNGVAYIVCSSRASFALAPYYYDLSIKKEIVTLNSVQEDIRDAVEDAASEKLDKVLCSPDGSQWVLTISNDGNIVPIKLRATGDGVDTSLTLPQSLGVGTYTLKYEDANGIITNYSDICSLEIADECAEVSYNGLIAENCAPEGATAIGVYNSSNERVAELDLGFLSNSYSGKLYSFGAISDVHIGQADSVDDFTNAVAYFEENEEIKFTTICGDMVDNSSKTNQLETYQSIAGGAEKPIYVVTGNHEALNYPDGEDFDSIKSYFAQDNYPNINEELYYSFTYNDDVFIMLGVYGSYVANNTFSQEELQWLYETLEANRNKRCFLFLHYFPTDGSGDAVDCYNSKGLSGDNGTVFYSLLKHYKNVIYFHGHSHAMFEVQELNGMNTIDSIYGRYSVHIPSLTWPTYPNDAMSNYVKFSSASQGYVVDVYEHGIALRGIDFENGEFSPIGTFYLDTVIEQIPANSFYDETGTLEISIK